MKKTKMLKKNYEFQAVLTRGKCFSGKNIIAFIQKNKQATQNFLGIAISSKTCNAVRRNHIKRLVKESYYHYEEQISTGNNIVFLWNKRANPNEVAYKSIKEDIKKIFQQAKIFINT